MFVLVIALVGCGGDDSEGGSTVITPDEPWAEVSVGDDVIIEVDENGSVGDNWIVTEPPDQEVVEFVSDEHVQDEVVTEDSETPLVGVGGVHRFTYAATGEGSTSLVIHNCFRCDAEGNTPAEDAQFATDETFEITVD